MRCPTSAAVLLAFGVSSCGSAQRTDPDPRGTLRFSGTPEQASIEVDDVRLGPLAMFSTRGLLLRPGQHRVVVQAQDYFSEYRLVEVVEGEVVVLQIDLRPVPP